MILPHRPKIEGRLLLLPKDYYERSAEYFASISSGMDASDEQVDNEYYKDLRKIDVKDLLNLLFPLYIYLFSESFKGDTHGAFSTLSCRPPKKPVVPEPFSIVEPTRDPIYYLDMVVFQVCN